MAFQRKKPAAIGVKAPFPGLAFDLLYLDGYDLRKVPLAERKAHLKKLIDKTIQFSESFAIDGGEIFGPRLLDRARGRRLEGCRQPLTIPDAATTG
jgi:ATP-dependent DNA ligase